MATEDVILNYRGDASSLVRASTEASESLSDLADHAKKKAKEAATAAEDAIKRAQRAAERATAEGSDAAREAARNAARSATNAIEEAKRAAEGANSAVQRSNQVMQESFDAIGDTSAKLGGALQAAGIDGSQALGDAADAAQVLSASAAAAGASTAAISTGLVLVAQVLGAGYLYWKGWNEETERNKELAKAWNASMEGQNDLLADTRDTLIELQVANQELTEGQGELKNAQQAAFDSYLANTEATRSRLAALRAEMANMGMTIDLPGLDAFEVARPSIAAFAEVGEMMRDLPFGSINPFVVAIDGATTSYSEMNEEAKRLNAILDENKKNVARNVSAHEKNIEAQEKEKEATKKAAAAKKVHTTATRSNTDALMAQKKAYADSVAAMEEEARLNRDIRAGIEALKEAAREASTIEREGSQGVRDAREAELAQLLQMYQETMALMGADADRAAATAAYTEAQIAIRAKYHRLEREAILEQDTLEAEQQAERDARAEEELAKRAEELAAMKAMTIDSAMEIADALSVLADTRFQQEVDLYNNMQKCFEKSKEGMTEAERKAAKDQLKEQRKAAKTAFRINQAIQMAQAIAGSALAILNAFATVPYPGSLVAAAAATATGVATVATIAAQKPQFHQGGIVQANLLPGEGVANRDLVRAVGESNFEAMNRNPAAAAQTLSGGGTTLIIGRREVGELGRSLMIGRTPVSSAITSRPKAGQLAAGTTTLPVLA